MQLSKHPFSSPFKFGIAIGLLNLAGALSCLQAQENVKMAASAPQIARTMRVELAESVALRKLTADQAVEKLATSKSPMGIKGATPGTEQATAVIDVANILFYELRDPEDAAPFYAIAEKLLAAESARASSDKTKASQLQQLAWLRANYLGKADQAKKDIEQAIALQPSDDGLKKQRAVLASAHGDAFQGQAPGRN